MRITPDYTSMQKWEDYGNNLLLEYKQSVEEGLDIEKYKDLFETAAKLEPSPERAEIADALFNIINSANSREDYKYNEPSDLEGIRKLCPDGTKLPSFDKEKLSNKLSGAWLGRAVGCLLGKPIEGIRTDELNVLIKTSGNYPMHRYIVSDDITDDMYENFRFRLRGRCFADTVSCAPVDDDTNYTVLYQMVVDKYGRDFTAENVGEAWLDLQPKRAYCTAERVAFLNLAAGYKPPFSAIYKNPFREWIGAQIRGDYFGYINPGDPKTAADMAWRDASVSHIKNGIYGEMFIAAMIACAACDISIEDVIMGGLSQVPLTSRLYEKVTEVIEKYRSGVSCQDCFKFIHEEFDEYSEHGWCHTISNAMIVTAALLYGKGDFTRSICLAVQTGFDTDCNGATVGSVIGMMYGTAAISEDWAKPINGVIDTSIFGVGKIDISSAVQKTLSHIK
ncbi:MAG: ADP-ribosylglycohydrolase family protein [Clostridia bacterium]|nr:ADP-ribosylglycohydrolase family protein [Clostridia bacterium]